MFSHSRSDQFWKPNTISEQEENSGDPYDFVSNLRSAIQKEISVIMDVDGVYPDYSSPQKRRMQKQLSALVDMLDVPPRYPVYALSPNRRFLPQQLMGWKREATQKQTEYMAWKDWSN